jgi:hypothetical protein
MPDAKPISDVAAETKRAKLDVLYLLADPHDGPHYGRLMRSPASWTTTTQSTSSTASTAQDSSTAPAMASSSPPAQRYDKSSYRATSSDIRTQTPRSHGRGVSLDPSCRIAARVRRGDERSSRNVMSSASSIGERVVAAGPRHHQMRMMSE